MKFGGLIAPTSEYHPTGNGLLSRCIGAFYPVSYLPLIDLLSDPFFSCSFFYERGTKNNLSLSTSSEQCHPVYIIIFILFYRKNINYQSSVASALPSSAADESSCNDEKIVFIPASTFQQHAQNYGPKLEHQYW